LKKLIFFRAEGNRYHCAQTKGIYVNRTSGGNLHCCVVDGDIDAGTTASKKAGEGGYLSVSAAPMEHCLFDGGGMISTSPGGVLE